MLCMTLSSFALAQNIQNRRNLSVQVGANIFNFVNFSTADLSSDDGETQIAYDKLTGGSVPTIQIAYDYALKNWISIGGAASYNSLQMEFTNLNYTGSDGERITGNGGFRAGRTSFNMRTLFHYGNTGRIDMYSGVRLGLSVWRAKSIGNLQGENIDGQIKNINLTGLRGTGVLPQFALTVFGLRGYFNDNLGAGFEINAGSPYVISAGLNYRF